MVYSIYVRKKKFQLRIALLTCNINESHQLKRKQGRKRPLDTPKRMIERRRERDARESHRALPYRVCEFVENLREISQAEK